MLFSLEEASSWWSHKLMWRALTATTLATVLLHLCEKGFKLKESNLAVYGLLSLEVDPKDKENYVFWASSLVPLAYHLRNT